MKEHEQHNHHEAALKAVLHIAEKSGLSVENIILDLEKDIEKGVGAAVHIPVSCSEDVIHTVNQLGRDIRDNHSHQNKA